MRNTIALFTGASVLFCLATAHADVLTIGSIESGTWNETVTALRADAASQIHAVHVVARDDAGHRVACGGYTITLDPAASRAFAPGACDAATSATELRVVDREALFDAEHHATAVSLLATSVTAPTARTEAATSPVVPTPPGGSPTTLQMLPAIVSDASGGTCATAPELLGGSTVMGTTLNASRRPMYVMRLTQPASIRLFVSTDFGGEVDFHRGCPTRRPGRVATSMVFGGGPVQRLTFDLRPGTYYVSFIDADVHAHQGEYTIETQVEPDYLAMSWGR